MEVTSRSQLCRKSRRLKHSPVHRHIVPFNRGQRFSFLISVLVWLMAVSTCSRMSASTCSCTSLSPVWQFSPARIHCPACQIDPAI